MSRKFVKSLFSNHPLPAQNRPACASPDQQDPVPAKGTTLKVLFDSHVKKAAVEVLRRRAVNLDAIHLADWRQGPFLHADDADTTSLIRYLRRPGG